MRKLGKRYEIILAFSFLVCQLILEILGTSLWIQISFAVIEFFAAVVIMLRKTGGMNKSG